MCLTFLRKSRTLVMHCPSVTGNTANEDLLFTCPDPDAVDNNGETTIKSLALWPHPSIANSTKNMFIYQCN